MRGITPLKRRHTWWPTYGNHITNYVRIVASDLSYKSVSMDVFYIFSNFRKYYKIYVVYNYTIFLIELMWKNMQDKYIFKIVMDVLKPALIVDLKTIEMNIFTYSYFWNKIIQNIKFIDIQFILLRYNRKWISIFH